MKKYITVVVAILAMVNQVFAQQRIEVSLTLAYNMFIIGEPVLVQARVTNLMRDPLELGDDASETFLIEVCKDNRYSEIAPATDKPFLPRRLLASGGTFEHRLEVDKWFPLYDSGRYLIRAVIVHNNVRYESALKSFDIVPGIVLKEGLQMFAFRKHLQRNFKLVHWTRGQSKHLFLRVEDEPDGLVWDTIDLGELYQDEEPKLDIAPNGEVSVFHRANASHFLRTVIWSLQDSVEIAERNILMNPGVAASQRIRAHYSDTQKTAEKEKSSWWKFWK
ncbi:MAG: hypothetical protein FWH21_00820 [Kiritimatiellaeota bacterium]|nr:hypothetical protein [Kiritimatiellota bacterium]